MTRPLDHVTVVSLEQAIAAPYCTRQLADLGARVIKVERPGEGDFARAYDDRVRGLSSHFVWVNRGKESLALDLKRPLALEALRELLRRADVLVQNLAPGATRRLGLDHATLAPDFPRLVVCDISGYGDDGPYAGRKAYDLLVQAESGFLSVTGTGPEACKAGISVADIAAGMQAYSAILAALLQREKTGRGARVEVSMLESMVEWMGFPMYYAYDDAPPPTRSGAAHATIYPYGPFQAGDGGTVVLGVQNEREWRAFCIDVLAKPELAEDACFASNALRHGQREVLRPIIEARFAELSTTELMRRLDDAGIACAQSRDMAGLWSHPQLAARDAWREVTTSAGPVRALRPPARHSDFEPSMTAIPVVGAHTRAILEELGWSPRRVAELSGP